jgi:hypothetical protein
MNNIKDGDIITLENGDIVKISLTKIGDAVTSLTPNHKYKLRHSGQFCHTLNNTGLELRNKYIVDETWTYIGQILLNCGHRHVFFHESPSTYSMFGVDSLDFVVCEVIE